MIIGRVVRRPVKAERNAGVVADQPHRQRGVGDVGADLFAGEQRQKRGEGCDVGNEARRGETGRTDVEALLEAHRCNDIRPVPVRSGPTAQLFDPDIAV